MAKRDLTRIQEIVCSTGMFEMRDTIFDIGTGLNKVMIPILIKFIAGS